MTSCRISKNGLTDKQNAFVDEYLSNGFSSVLAAKKAGFKSPAASTSLLANTKIAALIEKRRAKLAFKFDVTREQIAQKLIDIADNTQDGDRVKIAAIAEINKMFGFNEPAKTEIDVKMALSTVVMLPSNNR